MNPFRMMFLAGVLATFGCDGGTGEDKADTDTDTETDMTETDMTGEPEPTCESWCTAYLGSCGADASNAFAGAGDATAQATACAGFCTVLGYEAGTAGATSGNTLACREYHAGAAVDAASATTHCPHAGPSGGAMCGTLVENFCQLEEKACTGENALSWMTDCETDAANFNADGLPNAPSGNTIQCRYYHLSVALTPGQAATHCPHGAEDGGGVCVDAAATGHGH